MVMAKTTSAHVKRPALSRIFLWLFLPLLMLIVCLPQAQARPKSMEELAAIMGKLVETGVSYGAIPSLYRPRYDRVMDADLNTIRRLLTVCVRNERMEEGHLGTSFDSGCLLAALRRLDADIDRRLREEDGPADEPDALAVA